MDNQIILGIDIDGTLADTMELWLEFYREDYNVVVSKEDIVVYNMSKIFPEITFEKMREYFEKAWKNWEKIKPVPNEEEIKKLNSLDKKYRIEIVTSTWGEIGNIKKWLEKYNIKYHALIFVKNPEEKPNYCDILVDDKASNIREMIDNKKDGILLEQPWSMDKVFNKPNVKKIAKSWDEVLDYLK
jgi:uncharacterized HAD superfamily protein